MTRPLIIFIAILSSLASIGQKQDSLLVSSREIKDFLSEIKSTNLKNTIRLSDKPYSKFGEKFVQRIIANDTIFKKSDFSFIQLQINQTRNFLWGSSLIDSAILIKAESIDSIFQNFKPSDTAWRIFRKTFGKDFYRISIPLFTHDMNTCIIYIGHHCGGLCGEGSIMIFRRQKNKWTLYKTVAYWVS